jgi:hypothetical protein
MSTIQPETGGHRACEQSIPARKCAKKPESSELSDLEPSQKVARWKTLQWLAKSPFRFLRAHDSFRPWPSKELLALPTENS